jgi:D-inositol-3-phosphate glycosyltransferase
MNLYVRRLADELADEGLVVDVFTRRSDRQTPDIVTSHTGARFIHLSAGPARVLPKATLPLYIPSLVAGLREFTQREGTAYDVVHAHYWLSGLVAIRSRGYLDAPVITMFHTLAKVKEHFAGSADLTDSPLRADSERCVISGSDIVVGATAGERELMRDLYGRSPRQFEVIPPGVRLDLFAPRDRQESRRALRWGEGPIILYVGRFDPMKGLGTLLDALGDQQSFLPPETRLVIIGDDGRGGASLRHQARKLGIDHLVDFQGLVAPDELPLYYSAADICAVPSVYESFGMAAVEAMACGTPVVAFDVGGLRATVRDGQSGLLVKAGNREDFGRAILHALTECDLGVMGRLARLNAQRFSWRRSVADTRALYDAAAADQQCFCRWVAGA